MVLNSKRNKTYLNCPVACCQFDMYLALAVNFLSRRNRILQSLFVSRILFLNLRHHYVNVNHAVLPVIKPAGASSVILHQYTILLHSTKVNMEILF